MCFVHLLTAGFTTRNITAWLTTHSGMVHGWETLSLCWWICAKQLVFQCWIIPYIQLLPLKVQQSFAIVVPKKCIHLPSDKCVLMWSDDPQSESEYPINSVFELPSYFIKSSFVPWRYLNTCFAYLMCESNGLLLYHDNHVAVNAMSGLVPMAA